MESLGPLRPFTVKKLVFRGIGMRTAGAAAVCGALPVTEVNLGSTRSAATDHVPPPSLHVNLGFSTLPTKKFSTVDGTSANEGLT